MTKVEPTVPRRRLRIEMGLAVAAALLVGSIVGRYRATSATLLLLCFVILAGVFLSPEFALGFAIVAQTNFLGVVDPQLFSIPGLFKVSDVAFVLLAVPFLQDLATGRFHISRFRTAFFWPVALIIGVALFNIVLSNLREGVPFALGFRIGRRYIFYAVFFVAFYYLTDARHLRLVLRGCRMAGAMAALVVVTIFFTGSELLSGGMVTGQFPTHEEFTRPYSPAFPLIILVFFDSLARMLAGGHRTSWTAAILLGVTMAGILVDLSRNGWIAVIMGSAWVWWAMRRGRQLPRWRAARLAAGAVAALFVLNLFAGQVSDRDIGDALKMFGDRFVSTFADLTQVRGTFGERIDILTTRVRLMAGEPTTFLWGLGFATTQARAMEIELTQEIGIGDFTLLGGENGVATVLVELGVLGLIGVAWLSWLVVRRGYWLATHAPDRSGRILGPALAGCQLCFVVQFLSLSSLSFAYGPYVMVTALLMALVERQHRLSTDTSSPTAAVPAPGAGL